MTMTHQQAGKTARHQCCEILIFDDLSTFNTQHIHETLTTSMTTPETALVSFYQDWLVPWWRGLKSHSDLRADFGERISNKFVWIDAATGKLQSHDNITEKKKDVLLLPPIMDSYGSRATDLELQLEVESLQVLLKQSDMTLAVSYTHLTLPTKA